MWEWLICPQHGLLRPDNIALLTTYFASIRIEFELLYMRAVVFFGRYL